MEHVFLGRTGVKVSTLAFGTMSFGGDADEPTAAAMYERCRAAGINLFDCADVYNQGRAEEILGRLVGRARDEVVLTTKAYFPTGPGPNDRGSSRYHLRRAVEASLRRLGTDHIDLYQVHRPDPLTDIDETLGALSDLLHQGKVRAIGTSTFAAHELVEAQWVAEKRGRERFRCEQPPYSILARGIETAVLPTCERYGMGVIPWSPLAGGWLTGRYRRGDESPTTGRAARIPERFDFSKPENQRWQGKRLSEIAAGIGKDYLETAMDLILSENSRVETIYFLMSEDNVRMQLRQPWMKFGTDAGGPDPGSVRGMLHPRSYGTYPRILGRYVRDEGVLTLEDAVRKASGAVATRLMIRGRGELRPGNFADIVVFDPRAIVDRATFEEPLQLSTGVLHVWVNGVQVLRDGNHTGAKPGRALRGPGYRKGS